MKSFKVMMMLVVALLSVANVQAQDNNENVIFYESFDGMNGKGGNDGNWNIEYSIKFWTFNTKGTINKGWDNTGTDVRPANKCIIVGTTGNLVSPAIGQDAAKATLTFRAGATCNSDVKLKLTLENGGTFVSNESNIVFITLDKNKFTDYSLEIANCTAETKIAFTNPDAFKALLLDEVKIVKENIVTPNVPSTPTGINSVKKNTTISDNKVYNLNGQLVGTSTQNLKQGVYIINNKKVVVK